MKIAILGAGAWGTALAISACRNPGPQHAVSLWAREQRQVQALQDERVNRRYLPGLAFPPALAIHPWPLDGHDAASAGAWAAALVRERPDLVVVATPMAGLREVLEQLRDCPVPLAWLCKGFEEVRLGASPTRPGAALGLLAHEVLYQAAPRLQAGVLSGPSFAQEVARGQPTALVAASASAGVRALLVQAFHSPSLRVYASDDVVGVEVGGAVKNVLPIATGLCDGLQLGLNARAALVTRGLAEMTRLGVALGARPETFMGLSGLGDLVLTATGDLSRNRKVGLALAQGQTLQQAVAALGHVAEGVVCARTVVQRARALNVDMPICSAVEALLDARLSPTQALAALMGREARDEL